MNYAIENHSVVPSNVTTFPGLGKLEQTLKVPIA